MWQSTEYAYLDHVPCTKTSRLPVRRKGLVVVGNYAPEEFETLRKYGHNQPWIYFFLRFLTDYPGILFGWDLLVFHDFSLYDMAALTRAHPPLTVLVHFPTFLCQTAQSHPKIFSQNLGAGRGGCHPSRKFQS